MKYPQLVSVSTSVHKWLENEKDVWNMGASLPAASMPTNWSSSSLVESSSSSSSSSMMCVRAAVLSLLANVAEHSTSTAHHDCINNKNNSNNSEQCDVWSLVSALETSGVVDPACPRDNPSPTPVDGWPCAAAWRSACGTGRINDTDTDVWRFYQPHLLTPSLSSSFSAAAVTEGEIFTAGASGGTGYNAAANSAVRQRPAVAITPASHTHFRPINTASVLAASSSSASVTAMNTGVALVNRQQQQQQQHLPQHRRPLQQADTSALYCRPAQTPMSSSSSAAAAAFGGFSIGALSAFARVLPSRDRCPLYLRGRVQGGVSGDRLLAAIYTAPSPDPHHEDHQYCQHYQAQRRKYCQLASGGGVGSSCSRPLYERGSGGGSRVAVTYVRPTTVLITGGFAQLPAMNSAVVQDGLYARCGPIEYPPLRYQLARKSGAVDTTVTFSQAATGGRGDMMRVDSAMTDNTISIDNNNNNNNIDTNAKHIGAGSDSDDEMLLISQCFPKSCGGGGGDNEPQPDKRGDDGGGSGGGGDCRAALKSATARNIGWEFINEQNVKNKGMFAHVCGLSSDSLSTSSPSCGDLLHHDVADQLITDAGSNSSSSSSSSVQLRELNDGNGALLSPSIAASPPKLSAADNIANLACVFWQVGCCFKGQHCPFQHNYPNSGEKAGRHTGGGVGSGGSGGKLSVYDRLMERLNSADQRPVSKDKQLDTAGSVVRRLCRRHKSFSDAASLLLLLKTSAAAASRVLTAAAVAANNNNNNNAASGDDVLLDRMLLGKRRRHHSRSEGLARCNCAARRP